MRNPTENHPAQNNGGIDSKWDNISILDELPEEIAIIETEYLWLSNLMPDFFNCFKPKKDV